MKPEHDSPFSSSIPVTWCYLLLQIYLIFHSKHEDLFYFLFNSPTLNQTKYVDLLISLSLLGNSLVPNMGCIVGMQQLWISLCSILNCNVVLCHLDAKPYFMDVGFLLFIYLNFVCHRPLSSRNSFTHCCFLTLT